MHVLFAHRNFPAQFGHIASHLATEHGWRCTFVSESPPQSVAGIDNVQYRRRGGPRESTHPWSRAFETRIWEAAAVYETLKPVSAALRPDVIVGHSGFGPTLFLKELFPDVPIVSYFEYFYGTPQETQRPDVRGPLVSSDSRNATILLDLEYCTAGYTPTRFQHALMPKAYRDKLTVLHDGIDTRFWCRRELPGRTVVANGASDGPDPGPMEEFWRAREARDQSFARLELDADTRLVTYVASGLESIRGFHVFMQAAKKIYEAYPDVRFAVVGEDRVVYGGDLRHIEGKSFKEHVLAQDDYDLERIMFLGAVRPSTLVQLLSLSDLHVYLTVPFVLSWSLLDAMACECVVLGSDTAPVREVIADRENGLLCDFFDVDGLAERATEVLRDPARFRELGAAGRRTVEEGYSMGAVMPRMVRLLEAATAN